MRAVSLALAAFLALAGCTGKKDEKEKDGATSGEPSSEPPANSTTDVQVKGDVTVPDDDLSVIAPAATTLALTQAAESDQYRVYCQTLGKKLVRCDANVKATGSKTGTFNAICRDAAGESLACWLAHGTTVDTILMGDDPQVTVGGGDLVLKIAAQSHGLAKSPVDAQSSSALANAADAVTRVGSTATALPTLAGDWSTECVDDPDDPFACEEGYPKDVYVSDATEAGQRAVSLWTSKRHYDQCYAGGSKPSLFLQLSGKKLTYGLASMKELYAFLDEVYGAIPDGVKSKYHQVYTAGSEGRYTARECADPAGQMTNCATVTDGPHSGKPAYERDAIRHELMWVLADFSRGGDKQCANDAPPSIASCLNDDYAYSGFCWNLDDVHRSLKIDLDAGGKLGVPSSARSFAECLNKEVWYDSYCQQVVFASEDLQLELDGKGHMNATMPVEGELFWFADGPEGELCPKASASTGDSDAYPKACRAEFAAMDAAAQAAALLRSVASPEYVASACPGVAAPVKEEEEAAAGVACRKAFLALADTARMQAVSSYIDPVFPLRGAICADKTFAQQLADGGDKSCLPYAIEWPYDCEGAACKPRCDDFPGGDCLDAQGRYVGMLTGRLERLNVKPGVNGAFSMLERFRYEHASFETNQPCTATSDRIHNATLADDQSFSSIRQDINYSTCPEDQGYDQAWTSRYVFRRK